MSEGVHNSVRAHRKEAKVTQADLARALRVSRQTINSIERGRYIPSLPLALGIARFFACPVDDVFRLEDPERFNRLLEEAVREITGRE
jgi:putative transcriptional regulator